MQSKATSTGAGDRGPRDALDKVALAAALRGALGLRHQPVALAFVAEAPGIEPFPDAVPSACTFWRRAEDRVFFASADSHFNCPIGAFTMGFSMVDEQRERLMELVAKMAHLGYVRPQEAENIPSVPGEKAGIVYGPLERFPLEPDAVVAFVDARAAMLLQEATEGARWTAEQTGTPMFGRPTCAAIAVSVRRQTTAFSAGCAGMRTFTGVDPELVLAVLPRVALGDLPERLAATVEANAAMDGHYRAQKALVNAGADGA